MTTICPKCQHVRQPNATVPDWQCPSCSVVYAKVNDVVHSRMREQLASNTLDRQMPEIPWRRLFMLVALILLIWLSRHMLTNSLGLSHDRVENISVKNPTLEELQALAATVKPGEVTMYSTTGCQYCVQAKGWLSQYGFAYTECNLNESAQCLRDFKSFGATGTPYLVVRRRHMKDGFDSDEFLTLLSL